MQYVVELKQKIIHKLKNVPKPQLQNTCLACVRPWIQPLTTQNSYVIKKLLELDSAPRVCLIVCNSRNFTSNLQDNRVIPSHFSSCIQKQLPFERHNYNALRMSLTLEEKQNQMHTKEILGLHCGCEAGETLWLEFPESSAYQTTPLYTRIKICHDDRIHLQSEHREG